MAALTQHRPHGAIAGRRFGSFAGKTVPTGTTVAIPAAALTLTAYAPTVYYSGSSTTSVSYLPLRAYADGSSGTVDPSSSLDNLRSLLPAQRTPIGKDKDGNPVYVEPTWYRFFDYLVNVYLGSLQQPTIPDIVASVETAATQAASSSETTTLIAQQAQANAEALAAVVQVAQNAALAGAEQIPPVSLSYMEP